MKEVYIKMSISQAIEVSRLLKKLGSELYSGDDYESRSTTTKVDQQLRKEYSQYQLKVAFWTE